MNVKFCDRCKRKIKYNEVNDVFIRNYATDCLLRKEMCEECTNDIINIKMIHDKVKKYLKRQYKGWKEEDLYYKKGL